MRSSDWSSDVCSSDLFHVINAGRLMTGGRGAEAPLVPCTPLGCLMLLKDRVGDLSGLNAVVVGRSHLVGKPMAPLLLAESSSEERRVGKECVSTDSSRWSPDTSKKKKNK